MAERDLDLQLGQYENLIFKGDFILELNDATMKNPCQIYGCKNIINNIIRYDLF